jgi:hypothetical protein
MTEGEVSVAIAASRAAWAGALRNYIRDHGHGLQAETLLDSRQLTTPARPPSVLMLDDVSRLLSEPVVRGCLGRGIFVVGITDGSSGLGRAYLEGLGVQLILPSTTPPGELVGVLLSVGHRTAATRPPSGPPPRRPNRSGERGSLVAWVNASGGAGITETIVAVAEGLSARGATLVVEADPGACVLAARLNRSPDHSLTWAIGRWREHGGGAVPVTAAREDGGDPVGTFDLIAQSTGTGMVGAPSSDQVWELVESARWQYKYVLVSLGGGDLAASKKGAATASLPTLVMAQADAVLVGAAADPLGALALGQWKANHSEAQLANCWALFGRSAGSKFEETNLVKLLEHSTGAQPFASYWFLPEDEKVQRARWNVEMVRAGKWSRSVGRLTEALLAVPAASEAVPDPEIRGWGMVLSR